MMETPTPSEERVADAYVTALAVRSTAGLQACLRPDVRLRALVPPGFRESKGIAEVTARLESWFAEPERIEVLAKTAYRVSERLHIRYRFAEHYPDGASEVIEQDAYCEIHEGLIESIDLLCSGHLPMAEAGDGAVHRFDAGELGCGSGLPQEFRRRIGAIPVGEVLETVTQDPASREDLPALARLLGHRVISVTSSADGKTVVTVRRER